MFTFIMISSICRKFNRKLLRTFFSRKPFHDNINYCTGNLTDSVIITKQKQLYLIGINRPEKRNAINQKTSKELKYAFEQFENDGDVNAAVLYGKGGNFCSGLDLEEIASGAINDQENNMRILEPIKKVLSKPIVAAINGYAVAEGFELALWCDLRVIEETAVMGFYNRRFGVPIRNGSTSRLPKLIGLSRALDIILTGRSINAKEAFEIGLATKLTACGTAIGNAISLANSLCKFPQECLKADRLSTYHASYDSQSLEEALNFEFQKSSGILELESVKGAERFMQGVGRHGKFHLDVLEKQVS